MEEELGAVSKPKSRSLEALTQTPVRPPPLEPEFWDSGRTTDADGKVKLAPPTTWEPVKAATTNSWRDVVKIHPAADLFPMMGSEELQALADDIKKDGLLVPAIVVTIDGRRQLIDGRNRLDAMELVGLPTTDEKGRLLKSVYQEWKFKTPGTVPPGKIEETVVSFNIHRRHLTAEQKRDLLAKLIKANPERSDRAIAKLAQVSDKTVAAQREKLEATAEIPQSEKRVGADGKARGRKPKPAARPIETLTPEELAEGMRRLKEPLKPGCCTFHDTGGDLGISCGSCDMGGSRLPDPTQPPKAVTTEPDLGLAPRTREQKQRLLETLTQTPVRPPPLEPEFWDKKLGPTGGPTLLDLLKAKIKHWWEDADDDQRTDLYEWFDRCLVSGKSEPDPSTAAEQEGSATEHPAAEQEGSATEHPAAEQEGSAATPPADPPQADWTAIAPASPEPTDPTPKPAATDPDAAALELIQKTGKPWVGPTACEELGIDEATIERLLAAGKLVQHPKYATSVGLRDTAALELIRSCGERSVGPDTRKKLGIDGDTVVRLLAAGKLVHNPPYTNAVGLAVQP